MLQIIEERNVLNKSFRIYGTFENPLFLAKDVTEWIEYEGRTGQFLTLVDEAEKLTHTIYASGQNREMWFLTEDGLYEVLMQSRKPIAKQFKAEVKRILKEIRTTGGFVAPNRAIDFVNHWIPDLDDGSKTVIAGMIETNLKLKVEIKQKDDLLLKAKPKIDFFNQVASSKDAIDIGSASKVLNMGVGRNTLFEILRAEKILMENNQPYQQFIDRGYFRVIEQKFATPEGEIRINIKTLVFQKGLDFIRKVLENRNQVV